MSAENPNYAHDGQDAYANVMLRRTLNEDFARESVNFYVAGLEAAEEFFGRPLDDSDVLADVGSSSGKALAEAAIARNALCRLVCVEPNGDTARFHRALPKQLRSGVDFIRATGENLPFKDNTLSIVFLHNVIIRADDPIVMLREIHRVLKPGGMLALSTNGSNHGLIRHADEHYMAEVFIRQAGLDLTIPPAPADGKYLQDIPAFVQVVEGLTITPELYIPQISDAMITIGERLDTYVEHMHMYASTLKIPAEYRNAWRQVIREVLLPRLFDRIALTMIDWKSVPAIPEPHFLESIERGMFVIRKDT